MNAIIDDLVKSNDVKQSYLSWEIADFGADRNLNEFNSLRVKYQEEDD